MKAAYCEIKRGRNCVTVNYYSKEGYGLELGCRKLERERREAYAAKRRRLGGRWYAGISAASLCGRN